jgi:hypothetical protein
MRIDAVMQKISGWLCCFCGQEIEETDIDPCTFTIRTSRGNDQAYACHGICFKKHIASEPPIFAPAHF